jgi:hypothetical protein
MFAFKDKAKQQKLWFHNFEDIASFVKLFSKQKGGLGILVFLKMLRIKSRAVESESESEGILGEVGVVSFKNRGVGVGAFVYRLHSPDKKCQETSRVESDQVYEIVLLSHGRNLTLKILILSYLSVMSVSLHGSTLSKLFKCSVTNTRDARSVVHH